MADNLTFLDSNSPVCEKEIVPETLLGGVLVRIQLRWGTESLHLQSHILWLSNVQYYEE